MDDAKPTQPGPIPPDGAALIEQMVHWSGIAGRMQMMLMEHGAAAGLKIADDAAALSAGGDGAKLWEQGMGLWQAALAEAGGAQAGGGAFAGLLDPSWQAPMFEAIRQTYRTISDLLLDGVGRIEGVDPKQKEQLRFATRSFIEAMSPDNFALTNPKVLARTIESRGQNLLTGLERMLDDVSRGQIRHVGKDAFELGVNIAITPGKVVYENELFQLIHYAPTTAAVDATPILIFPPWINRYYILDLSPEKSFVAWVRDQGFSVFIVSWKSADAGLARITMDDYVLKGELEALYVVTRLLDVPSAHVVGYCVAGTALSMLLAWAAANGKADMIASATFLTTQVDFSEAGELSLFVDDAQLGLLDSLAKDGTMDGRVMAATFNMLRGRELIWNYVVNNYLLAEDYAPFDLLHWNGDVSNLPAEWQKRYLTELYRDNLLATPGRLSVAGTPIDLSTIETPAYVQAGREDHIAPAASVWKLTHHFKGPLRFVLAGSGHIAGVVNHPAKGRYQYWLNDAEAATLDEFVAGAIEHKGSWWPDWAEWLHTHSKGEVPAEGARIPGEGALKAIEDAPGRYVRAR